MEPPRASFSCRSRVCADYCRMGVANDSALAPVQAQMRANLTRNLALMQRLRPETHAALTVAEFQPPEGVEIVPAPPVRRSDTSAHPLALARAGTNGQQLLGPARSDGTLGLHETERRAVAAPATKALLGIGDGAILDWLARNAPQRPFNAQFAVFVIEPDINAAVLALALRDFTYDRGPIRQPCFRWFVGWQWREQLRRELLEEPMLPDPAMLIGQSPQKKLISDACLEIAAEGRRLYDHYCEQANQYGRTVDAAHLAKLFRRHEAARNSHLRTPRVLLLTSRFTTVLRHSAHDAATALKALGWDARVLMEKQPYHMMTDLAVMREIAEYRPDLVFTIDHLRGERQDIPAELPFVCWIQDNLPHLMDARAGEKINNREFVTGAWVLQYVEQFGYPQRQCITIPRLAKRVQGEVSELSDEVSEAQTDDGASFRRSISSPRRNPGALDLVYVSNHSATPETAFQTLLSHYAVDADSQRLLVCSARRIAAMYERGESIGQAAQATTVLDEVSVETGIDIAARGDGARLAAGLFEGFNNVLFRQQAVRWAAGIATLRGLRFGLFGHGWDAHPEFHKFARGFVDYGRDLEELTRCAQINLQLEPYFPVSHQRLLDGLMAGGFFLSRLHNPILPLRARWAALIDELDESITTLADARSRLDDARRRELDSLHGALAPILGSADLVRMSREWRAAAEAPQRMRVPPRYEEIAFASEPELEERVERFLGDEPLRREIAAQQRRFVEAHFTYEVGLSMLLARMSELLATEAAEAGRELTGAAR
jgi:hypothetical protein